MLLGVCAQLGHIWKPLPSTERMGSGGGGGGGGGVGASWLRAGIITTADQTTSSFCLQLAPVRRLETRGRQGGHGGNQLIKGRPEARGSFPGFLRFCWYDRVKHMKSLHLRNAAS